MLLSSRAALCTPPCRTSCCRRDSITDKTWSMGGGAPGWGRTAATLGISTCSGNDTCAIAPPLNDNHQQQMQAPGQHFQYVGQTWGPTGTRCSRSTHMLAQAGRNNTLSTPQPTSNVPTPARPHRVDGGRHSRRPTSAFTHTTTAHGRRGGWRNSGLCCGGPTDARRWALGCYNGTSRHHVVASGPRHSCRPIARRPEPTCRRASRKCSRAEVLCGGEPRVSKHVVRVPDVGWRCSADAVPPGTTRGTGHTGCTARVQRRWVGVLVVHEAGVACTGAADAVGRVGACAQLRTLDRLCARGRGTGALQCHGHQGNATGARICPSHCRCRARTSLKVPRPCTWLPRSLAQPLDGMGLLPSARRSLQRIAERAHRDRGGRGWGRGGSVGACCHGPK
eukprot:m.892269 g.892269  ORF g.892269 m.892269 type:complete len:393 (-) comp23655_c0_seq2:646-1824(-)